MLQHTVHLSFNTNQNNTGSSGHSSCNPTTQVCVDNTYYKQQKISFSKKKPFSFFLPVIFFFYISETGRLTSF